METRKEAQEILAESLAWLLYAGSREVAQWAADCGWLLCAYDLFDRDVWRRECMLASEYRGRAFSGAKDPGDDDGSPCQPLRL